MKVRDLKGRYVRQVLMLTFIIGAFCVSTGVGVAAAGQQSGAAVRVQQDEGNPQVRWDLAVAIAIAIGVPCLAAGYAVGKVGAAALGAAAEKPELLTRSLLFVALAEGIAIYGLLVAVLLYLKM